MAVKKATTRSDIKLNEQQAANVEQDAKVSQLTDPAVLADIAEPEMVRVKSPNGAVTTVPQSIVQALLDSGYTK